MNIKQKSKSKDSEKDHAKLSASYMVLGIVFCAVGMGMAFAGRMPIFIVFVLFGMASFIFSKISTLRASKKAKDGIVKVEDSE